MRFALVGCGRIAAKHAEIMREGAGLGTRLVGVCDIVEARATAFAQRYGVQPFTDMHEMMSRLGPEVDVVNVLTPSGMHAHHCIALAPYGKHIVVEKPMALTMADAEAMIAACERADVRLFVVKQNRYNLPVVKLREALVAGRFGQLVLGTVRVRWSRDQKYYDQDLWRGTWALDGGVFANQASHHIDLLVWMLGDVESVIARTAHALADIEAEDTGAAIVRFKSGALGIIEATTATRPRDLEGSISILGAGGSVEIGGFAVNEMKTWRFATAAPGDEAVLDTFRENPRTVYGFGHRAYFEDVVDAVRSGRPALVEGREGRKSLEVICAIYESAASGNEVRMGFVQKHSRLGRGQEG